MIRIDGSRGEGGGQVLRSALTLSMITGRAFRIDAIRANRDRPGLRAQHLASVQAAAALCSAEILGATIGSRSLTFRPGEVQPRDFTLDVGTAGSTALVLQTIHTPLALKATSGLRVVLDGGTFNLAAPSYPFLEGTWRPLMIDLGLAVALAMPRAGFYPGGGGRLEAWIEPGTPRAIVSDRRGPLRRLRLEAGVCRLDRRIAERMLARSVERLAHLDVEPETTVVSWEGPGPGVALAVVADHGGPPATFVGLGERGKPAEAVADEAVDALLAHLSVPNAAIDPHSADQLLLPLALAEGRSLFTTSEISGHLRTNAETLGLFLDRPIVLEEADPFDGRPARVVVG